MAQNYQMFELVEKNGHKGIYIGDVEGEPVIVDLHDAPETMAWDKAKEYAQKEGKRLPSQRALMLMFVHQKKLNEAMTAAGGEPWENDWYWSSSEYTHNGAWYVSASNGAVGWSGKSYRYTFVRCVLAF